MISHYNRSKNNDYIILYFSKNILEGGCGDGSLSFVTSIIFVIDVQGWGRGGSWGISISGFLLMCFCIWINIWLEMVFLRVLVLAVNIDEAEPNSLEWTLSTIFPLK